MREKIKKENFPRRIKCNVRILIKDNKQNEDSIQFGLDFSQKTLEAK